MDEAETRPERDRNMNTNESLPAGAGTPGAAAATTAAQPAGNQDLVKRILAEIDNLGLDGRTTRHLKPRLEKAGTQAGLTAKVISEVGEKFEAGNERSKALADELFDLLQTMQKDAPETTKKQERGSAKAKGKAKTPTGLTGTTDVGPILLTGLSVHRVNRSYGIQLSWDRVTVIANSAKQVGLLSRVVLVRSKGAKDRYLILAGAHRIEALRVVRGHEGSLAPGEYIVLDIEEDDARCLEVSAAENRDRFGDPVVVTARYMNRLVLQEGLDQGEVADRLGIARPVVNALVQLPAYFDKLPDAWKKDLGQEPDTTCNADNTFAITISHWRLIGPKIKEAGGVTEALTKLMVRVAKEERSTAWLTKELKGKGEDSANGTPAGTTPLVPADAGGGKEQGGEQPPPASDPKPDGADYDNIITSLENAIKLANGDAKVMAVLQAAKDDIVKLQAAVPQQKVA